MAAIGRLGRAIVQPLLKSRSCMVAPSVRNYWNRDWRPAAYPETPEQREAAAKKYGLLPEDYEPYPDDGFGNGDYPKLVPVGADMRDPYENYDIPIHKRNYGEPMHAYADLYTEHLYTSDEMYRESNTRMVLSFLGLMTFLFGLFYLSIQRPIVMPVLQKQFPYDPKTGEKRIHYTFEPEE